MTTLAITPQEIPFGQLVSDLFSDILQSINTAIQVAQEYKNERLIFSILDSIEEAGEELTPSIEIVKKLLSEVEKAIPLTKEGSPILADEAFEDELDKRLKFIEQIFDLMNSVNDKTQKSILTQKVKNRSFEVMDNTANRLFELYHAMEELQNNLGIQRALASEKVKVTGIDWLDELMA